MTKLMFVLGILAHCKVAPTPNLSSLPYAADTLR